MSRSKDVSSTDCQDEEKHTAPPILLTSELSAASWRPTLGEVPRPIADTGTSGEFWPRTTWRKLQMCRSLGRNLLAEFSIEEEAPSVASAPSFEGSQATASSGGLGRDRRHCVELRVVIASGGRETDRTGSAGCERGKLTHGDIFGSRINGYLVLVARLFTTSRAWWDRSAPPGSSSCCTTSCTLSTITESSSSDTVNADGKSIENTLGVVSGLQQ